MGILASLKTASHAYKQTHGLSPLPSVLIHIGVGGVGGLAFGWWCALRMGTKALSGPPAPPPSGLMRSGLCGTCGTCGTCVTCGTQEAAAFMWRSASSMCAGRVPPSSPPSSMRRMAAWMCTAPTPPPVEGRAGWLRAGAWVGFSHGGSKAVLAAGSGLGLRGVHGRRCINSSW